MGWTVLGNGAFLPSVLSFVVFLAMTLFFNILLNKNPYQDRAQMLSLVTGCWMHQIKMRHCERSEALRCWLLPLVIASEAKQSGEGVAG
jgi:hypothetical protein